MTPRQSRRRDRVLAGGGMQLSVLLDRDAATALATVTARTGETQAAAVSRLLLSAAGEPERHVAGRDGIGGGE